MDAPHIHVSQTLDTLSQDVAKQWQILAQQAIRARGAFHVALAGGSTPETLYKVLAAIPFGNSLPWSQTHIYFGDERCVPLDHADSNYRMAKEALFDHVEIPPDQIHPMVTLPDDAHASANAYQDLLKSQNILKNSRGVPQFDLILLGMGPDGHTASLFPGSPLLGERSAWVAADYVASKEAWRVSFTFPLIWAAHKVFMLVAGDSKAGMVERAMRDSRAAAVLPVERLLAEGSVDWYMDKKAASRISR